MQIHLDGFRPGNPEIAAPCDAVKDRPQSDDLPAEVDVLIVGSGPAGLTLAAQLSAFPEIDTRIIEKDDGPLMLGKADGIACRTVEMFHAFGFAERVLKEACWINETTFWKPDPDDPARVIRSSRVQDVEDGLSEFPHVVLNQARVHDFFLDVMRRSPRRLEVDYGRRLTGLEIDREAGDHPVTARIERTDAAHAGQVETVRARYVVGCDGARSTVRRALGRPLEGEALNQAWGVMDVLSVTDFPDIRMKCLVQSAREGNLLMIPREGGYLHRIYVELDQLAENERVANRNITSDYLVAAAQRILRPYSFEAREVAWWSVYEIGHRITTRFDDVPEDGTATSAPRVFIAGDACHTHSPKMGQGMNVSMQDTFNLGWKLAHVLTGRSAPELLASYSAERRAIAQDLIDFDREWATMLSTPLRSPEHPDGVDPAEVKDHFVRIGRYTAGTATVYAPSALTGPATHQQLATGFPVGMRFHSAPVIRLADARPMHLGHTIEADGRWRVFAFAGREDPAAPASGIRALCDFLDRSPDSPVRRHTPAGADIDTVIDVRAVFQQGFRDLAIEAMPAFLLPRKGRYGLVDYEKMFCADLKSGDDIFDMRGIDRDRGCLVVVRPDQYVSHVLPLDAHDDLAAHFRGVLLDRR